MQTTAATAALALVALAVAACGGTNPSSRDPAEPPPVAAVPATDLAPARADPVPLAPSAVSWLDVGDVGEAADATAAARPTADAAELLRRLDLQVRAGHEADAVLAMDALRAAEPPADRFAVIGFVDALIDTQRDDLAMRLVERFPQAQAGWMYVLLERRARAEGWEPIDRWAAARQPAGPAWWIRERLRLRDRFGAAGPLLDELAAAARATPGDAEAFLLWLDAADAVSPRPDASWIADAAAPALAFDATRIGQRLHEVRAFAAAVRLLDRSLATPFTAADAAAQRTWLRTRSAAWPGPDSDERQEAILRRSTRFALADALLGAGDAARAQSVLESLAGDATATGDLPDLFLAGRIQGGSGARVVERRVLDAEEAESDTADYWRRRAAYFRGRGETERVREATARLLAVVDRELAEATWETAVSRRYFLVIEKADALRLLSGRRAAFDLFHAELAAIPKSLRESGFIAGFLAFDYREFLDADDPVLWRFLEERPAWDHQEDRLLWELAKSRTGAARDAVWARAEAVAASGPPDRSSVVGWVMTRTDASARAIPHLRAAVDRLPEGQPRAAAAWTLLEACRDTRDWRGAESAWRVLLGGVRGHPLTNEMRRWAAIPAVTAARAGAADDAMRLWAAKSSLDRGELSGLRDLRDAGLGGRLRAFYSDLLARDPKAAPAVSRAVALLGD